MKNIVLNQASKFFLQKQTYIVYITIIKRNVSSNFLGGNEQRNTKESKIQ